MASATGQYVSRNAGSPYGHDSTALTDIVLRSSDHTDFYVFKAFLRFVSPVFERMFNLPLGTDTNEKINGIPIISVTETSETLRLLLDFIYPYESEPNVDNIPLFLSACKATQKYGMVIVENRLKKQMISSHLMNREPLRLYTIAVNFGWQDVALIAARGAAGISLDKLEHVQELKNISGSEFYRFLEYKMRYDDFKSSSKKESRKVPERGTLMTLMTLPNLKYSAKSRAPIPLVPTPAQKPFGSAAKADTVLRSKDLVDFFVLADLFRVASIPSSSFSQNTIPLGNVIGKSEDGRSIVNVPEDSEVLRQLLNLVYHISDEIDAQDCRLYTQVVLAARRRGMTIIEARLRRQLTTSPLLLREPLRVYVTALVLGWDELAKSAALNTLSKPLDDMAYMEEFDLITGTDLYQLVALRFKCANAVYDVINSNSDYKVYGPGVWHWDHSTIRYRGPSNQLFKELRSCPRGSTIANAYHEVTVQFEENIARGFRRTPSSAAEPEESHVVDGSTLMKILNCRREIEEAVEAAVAKVPLNV